MIMVEQQQYLATGLPHSDDLSGVANFPDTQPSTTAPPASAYPDLTPYGAVSPPFSLSTPGDSTVLLTPISSAGSPLHQGRKLVCQYPPPPQQPTPPGSSKMYHHPWNHFDINGQSSQTSSPMAPQPSVASDFLDNNYLHDGRRTPGAPTEPYLGAFSVSDGTDSQPISHPYYMPVAQVDQSNPMMMRDSHPIPMGIHNREIPSAPLLNEPHPSSFRQNRRSSMDEHTLHSLSDTQRSVNGSPRRRALQAPNRVKKRQVKPRGQSSRAAAAENPLDEHKNCFGQEVPPTLKTSCPEEERCIFESRWKHRHQKGQDMWESIQSDFKNQFHKCPGKEMLQMKFKRGRSKYIQWHEKDEELLREAWNKVEKMRYQMILETFHELGGSRNMRLSASDVEVKVVNDLRLEEGLYMESHGDAHIRRRRKSTSTKKRTGPRGEDSEMPLSDEMMSVSSHNTTHEDEVINQVHSRTDLKWEEDSSGGNEVMDMQLWDQSLKMDPGVMPHRSERVARQDQMLRVSPGTQPMYGRRRGS